VHPAHQGQGVGRQILAHLMRWLDRHAPPQAFVGLFAAPGKEAFYRHFNFDIYPTLSGMFTVMPAIARRDSIVP
jgi:GNAT superfamily N-acetyltransferase